MRGGFLCSPVLSFAFAVLERRRRSDPARLCRPTKLATEPDLCTPSTLYSWCQTLAVPTTVASTCGMGCKDMSKCVQNALVGTGDANNKVCFTSGQVSQKPARRPVRRAN